MAQVTVHEAKTHLSRLIRRAQAGEEVVIARGDTPVVRLVASMIRSIVCSSRRRWSPE
jgi:prevent-host-death family protein